MEITMKRALLLSILFGYLLGCTTVTVVPDAAVPPISRPQPTIVMGDDESESLLLLLMTRILDNRSPFISYSQAIPEQPIVRVGNLPMDMPFSLPLMENATVLGSISRKDPLPYEVGIFLDVPHSAKDILAFYIERLAEQGFTEWRTRSTESFQSNVFVILCQEDKGIQLSLLAYEAPDSLTDVRITYDTNPAYVACNDNIPEFATYSQRILPTIDLPHNVVMLGSGGGGGAEGWAYSEQRIVTELTPTELHSLLGPGIQQDGWQLLDESYSPPVAWSKWALTDENGQAWSGVLIITSGAGSKNVRILKFQIELVHLVE